MSEPGAMSKILSLAMFVQDERGILHDLDSDEILKITGNENHTNISQLSTVQSGLIEKSSQLEIDKENNIAQSFEPSPLEKDAYLQHLPQKQASSEAESLASRNECRDLFKANFLEFLTNDPDGKIVLAHSKIKKNLNKETRGILTRTIIKKFKNEALKTIHAGQQLEKFQIPDKVLLEIAHCIQDIFPGEIASTYFSPFRSEDGHVVQKCGTLWANLNYTIDTLRKKGLLKKAKSKEKNKEESVPSNFQPAVAESLHNLERSLNPNTLYDDWKVTYNERKILLTVHKIAVNQYIQRFPCLRTRDAISLLELDFNTSKPGKTSLLRDRWPTIKRILLQQLEAIASKIATSRKKNIIDKIDDLSLIKILKTLNPDSQDAAILHLLQLLIGTGQVGGKRKKGETPESVTKYQPVEIRECFVYKVQDIDTEIEKLRERLRQRKETLQPFILITGSFTNINESFAVVNDQKYKVPSCLDALDLTFKLFFSLDCEYPRASVRLWQFIQHAAFDIHLPGEYLIKPIKELLGLTSKALREAELIQEEDSSLKLSQ